MWHSHPKIRLATEKDGITREEEQPTCRSEWYGLFYLSFAFLIPSSSQLVGGDLDSLFNPLSPDLRSPQISQLVLIISQFPLLKDYTSRQTLLRLLLSLEIVAISTTAAAGFLLLVLDRQLLVLRCSRQ